MTSPKQSKNKLMLLFNDQISLMKNQKIVRKEISKYNKRQSNPRKGLRAKNEFSEKEEMRFISRVTRILLFMRR